MVKDFRTNSSSWENQDIPSFLEAVAAWTDDMDGFYANQNKSLPSNIPWKVLAQVFYAAKVYE